MVDFSPKSGVYPWEPMAQLRCILIADPAAGVAQMIADETERLAVERLAVTSGDDVVRLAGEKRPEVVLLSLELNKPDATAVAKKLQKQHPDIFIMATFRELAVGKMDQLSAAGIEDFLPQPIDFVQLFRTASQRFGLAFRRHERYVVDVPVARVDGVLLGTTADLSEGGISFHCNEPTQAGQSLFVDLLLPGPHTKVRVRCVVLKVGPGETAEKSLAQAQFENLRGQEHQRLLQFLAGQPTQAAS